MRAIAAVVCIVLSVLSSCDLFRGTPTPRKPKVGLVLGGGGAKGAAHIGVIRYLESQNIKVDYVAGTSMGAVIGSLYSAGYSVDDIERMILSQKWVDIINGDKMEQELEYYFRSVGCNTFADTRIPFRCVATDTRGQLTEVVLQSGDLSKAVRASMSLPLVYRKISINGMQLIDGGLMNNLPVDVARQMGADVVIAVDLSKGSGKDFDFSLATFGISSNLNWFFDRPDKKKYNANVLDADVCINPNLSGYNTLSFGSRKMSELVDLGERSCRNYIRQINDSIAAKTR